MTYCFVNQLFNTLKVEAYGPGLQKTGVVIGQPTEFTIDCRKAGGHAPVDVSVLDDECKPVEVKVVDLQDGTFKATYKPTKISTHTVQVNYGGVAIPKSPFRVNIHLNNQIIFEIVFLYSLIYMSCDCTVRKVTSVMQVNVGEPTDSNKVRVFGPGVEPGVKAQVPTHFNIDCRGAGAGKIFLLHYTFISKCVYKETELSLCLK